MVSFKFTAVDLRSRNRAHTFSFFLCFSRSFLSFSFSALVRTLPEASVSSSPPLAAGAGLACCLPLPPLPFLSGRANSSSMLASAGAAFSSAGSAGSAGSAPGASSPSSSGRPFFLRLSLFLRIRAMRPPAAGASSSAGASAFSGAGASSAPFAGAMVSPSSASQSSWAFLLPFFLGAILEDY